jgi:hypothetical protein
MFLSSTETQIICPGYLMPCLANAPYAEKEDNGKGYARLVLSINPKLILHLYNPDATLIGN